MKGYFVLLGIVVFLAGCDSAIEEYANMTGVCFDSDVDDIFVKGTVKDNMTGKSYTDFCINSTLVEGYCFENSSLITSKVDCPNGCVDGACIRCPKVIVPSCEGPLMEVIGPDGCRNAPKCLADSCLDSDEGIIASKAGFVSGAKDGLEFSHEDVCNGDILTEFSCKNSSVVPISIKCAAGCFGAACLKSGADENRSYSDTFVEGGEGISFVPDSSNILAFQLARLKEIKLRASAEIIVLNTSDNNKTKIENLTALENLTSNRIYSYNFNDGLQNWRWHDNEDYVWHDASVGHSSPGALCMKNGITQTTEAYVGTFPVTRGKNYKASAWTKKMSGVVDKRYTTQWGPNYGGARVGIDQKTIGTTSYKPVDENASYPGVDSFEWTYTSFGNVIDSKGLLWNGTVDEFRPSTVPEEITLTMWVDIYPDTGSAVFCYDDIVLEIYD